MMEELKVLRDVTLYYNEQHPEKAPIAEDNEDSTSRQHGNTAGARAPTSEMQKNSDNKGTTKPTS